MESVLVISGDPQLVQTLGEYLTELQQTWAWLTPDQVSPYRHPPATAVCVDVKDADALALVRKVAHLWPQVSRVILGPRDTWLALAMLYQGACAYLPRTGFNLAQVQAALRRGSQCHCLSQASPCTCTARG
ncbi:MAG: hypothetical protein NZL92_05330 [Gloeomargarita sp. SKYG116]|nr:hypothetical protein [Gloeomargarita sp. SKYG116]MCS7292980.1 hypothetical protein [Gloeomargarita sp. SKYB120]MDW8178545.1 hypothetical protein [Gloeomargarita sp. SKYBB_i_bin120]MDW8401099.1 hypothetical protein [Gloeomargarita sp. SKYGB_i_bin116]